MKRSVLFEYIDKQLSADYCINAYTSTLKLCELHVFFYNDKGTCLNLGHFVAGTYDFRNGSVGETTFVILTVVKGHYG